MSITGFSASYNATSKRIYFVWNAYPGAATYEVGMERTSIDNGPNVTLACLGIISAGVYYFDITALVPIIEGTYRIGLTAKSAGDSILATGETFVTVSSTSPDTPTGGLGLVFNVVCLTSSKPIITGVELTYSVLSGLVALITFTGPTFTGGGGKEMVSYQALCSSSGIEGQIITQTEGVNPAGGGTYTLAVPAATTDPDKIFQFSVIAKNDSTGCDTITSQIYLVQSPTLPIDRRRRYWPGQEERADAMRICRCPLTCAPRRFTSYDSKMRSERARYAGCCCSEGTTAKLYAAVPRVQDGLPCSVVPPVVLE